MPEPLSEDESKLHTLIARLVKFKNLWDRDAALHEVLPTLYATHSERYAGYTLRQVCNEMHGFYREVLYQRQPAWQRAAFQRRVEDEIKRIGRGPDHGFAPDQASARGAERTLGEHDVEPSLIVLLNQFRADADLHLKLHTRMQHGETAKRRWQRAAGDFLDHAETHRA